MSRFPVKRLLLGCTADRAMLLALRAAQPAACEILASVAVTAPHLKPIAALCDALPGLTPQQPASIAKRASLCVTLDDALVRSFVVTPPGGAQGLRELRASAAARFAALYGEPAGQWLLAADWRASAPFITCAVPRELYQGFDRLAQSNGWRLDSVRPALVRIWNRLHASIPADGWLVVGFGQTLTVIHTRSGLVTGLRSLRLPEAPDGAELEALIGQERLRVPVNAGPGQQQSLLWTGAADWLPTAATMAGLPSRALPLRAREEPASELAEEYQLALAGTQQ